MENRTVGALGQAEDGGSNGGKNKYKIQVKNGVFIKDGLPINLYLNVLWR